ncbi:MAG: hypothetical protein RLZZ532_41 [Cyanobacteriota bacterium]|jgi:hypothetical protein
MKHGPVPSRIYDLLKLVRGDLSPSFQPPREISEQVLHAFKIVDKHDIKKLNSGKYFMCNLVAIQRIHKNRILK